MKEYPIILADAQVRALLGGATQLRIPLAKQPVGELQGLLKQTDKMRAVFTGTPWVEYPYGAPGDRLWGREYFAALPIGVAYRASAATPAVSALMKWTAPSSMARKYSRITRNQISVGVERLRDIDEEDARASGMDSYTATPASSMVERFRIFWGQTAGVSASWDKVNPYVWVVELETLPA